MAVRLHMTWDMPRHPETVTLARHLLDVTLTLLKVTAACRAELGLILTEACANAVHHADGEDYQVTVIADADRCLIEVTDAGAGLDLTSVHARMNRKPVITTAEHGRGMLFIRSFSDHLEVTSSPRRGTAVRISKNLTPDRPDGPR